MRILIFLVLALSLIVGVPDSPLVWRCILVTRSELSSAQWSRSLACIVLAFWPSIMCRLMLWSIISRAVDTRKSRDQLVCEDVVRVQFAFCSLPWVLLRTHSCRDHCDDYVHFLAWCLPWYSFMQPTLADTPGGRQRDRQDDDETIQRYDVMVRRERVSLLQACLVFGSICTAGLMQLLLLPVFDPFAKLRVVDHNLPTSLWRWRAAGCVLLTLIGLVLGDGLISALWSLIRCSLNSSDFVRDMREITLWERERDPQEEEVQHAGLDYEETIQRYDAMVRREFPFLQACLVYGSNCVVGLMQLLLLPVFDPFAKLRVVDHNLPTSLWRWRAAGCVLLTLIGLVLGDGLIPALWPLIPCSLVGVPSG
mmetsp:Transcript_29106/g.64360  ORF Transcript_29106/g.64360 Transcript_29106/m.64360 type:complete len:366 (+) Transcript_29106:158-1255(+)